MAAMAQQTTSSLRVSVMTPDGTPSTNASITVTDNRTGSSRSATVTSAGSLTLTGLRIGGPYTVKASAVGYSDQTVTDVFVRLGDTFFLPMQLGLSDMEEVIVTSAAVQTQQLALGPASTFNIEDLQDFPAINRDLRDVIRFDPRIYQDAAFVGAIQCAGASPRFNSLTVDGVRMNDNFGLNSNGYPTSRQPFPYDAIQQVSVELAPFDVQYGGFTGCNINAVTKSGANEFFGSAFYDYTNDSMKGDKLEGDDIDNGDFTEKRYGATLGGPIIKDKLFFFLAYEKLEGVQQFNRGGADSGAGDVVNGVSVAQLNEIASIAQNVYGYDVGGFPSTLPVEDEKIVAKLDWQINDDHRAAFTYNYNDGFTLSESDGGSSRLSYSNHYYERGAELKAYTLHLFSDWTDQFSTEVRAGNFKLDNRQLNIGEPGFGEVQIRTYNAGSSATVYLGVDDSRQSNKLNYETNNYKFAGKYVTGNHVITGGFERDELTIFNLFIQETEGEYRFDRSCSSDNPNGCIDAFAAGDLGGGRIYYENARPNNNPDDGAANWAYDINTAYAQDEITFAGGDVVVVAGLRYEWYTSTSLPRANPAFEGRNGFTNSNNFDGMSLMQPRLGINWDVNDRLSVRAGAGLYSGGNPNVWLSNNFSNDGATLIEARERVLDNIYGRGNWDFSTIPWTDSGRPIWDVPQDMYDFVGSGSTDGNVDAIDPNFKLPRNWKFSLGGTYELGDGYIINADLLYTKAEESAIVVRPNLVEVAIAPDGRPVYDNTRGFLNDTILTNVQGKDATALNLSLGISKSHDNGFDWSLGYAYTKAKDVSPMTSSTSSSNYGNLATYDPNNPGLAISNYSIPHRFTARLSYEAYWWGENRTKFSLFGAANQGRPYSYVFGFDDGDTFGDARDFRHLLYVPTGPSDPLVVFEDGFDQAAFFDFVAKEGLKPGIQKRNDHLSDWWVSFDLRIEQEIPGFFGSDRFSAFVVVKNFCNMLNDDWCVLREAGFPRTDDVVDMEIVDGKYLYESFINPGGQSRATDASLWEMRVGLKYTF
ncbi:MAG: TonB-dependent receptor [Gammaproteobacteria bacterium]|nr:TonB-dependent receptor [Gammaproteobacteria bacterium]